MPLVQGCESYYDVGCPMGNILKVRGYSFWQNRSLLFNSPLWKSTLKIIPLTFKMKWWGFQPCMTHWHSKIRDSVWRLQKIKFLSQTVDRLIMNFYHHATEVAYTLYHIILSNSRWTSEKAFASCAHYVSRGRLWAVLNDLCFEWLSWLWNHLGFPWELLSGSMRTTSQDSQWQSAALFFTQLSLCAQHTHPRLETVTAAQRHLINWDGPQSTKGSMC